MEWIARVIVKADSGRWTKEEVDNGAEAEAKAEFIAQVAGLGQIASPRPDWRAEFIEWEDGT